MNRWRLIVTDSETLSGVAPVCPRQFEPDGPHDTREDFGGGLTRYDAVGVHDCCPGPHIECWTDAHARRALAALNDAAAELCS